MTIREQLELSERTYLSSYAMLSQDSRGREQRRTGMRYSSGFSA